MANLSPQPEKDNLIVALFKVARPIHWIKNLSLFAALFLTGTLDNQALLVKVLWGFLAFNFATSATYIINDILDAKRDRLHPIKRMRPIASGSLPIFIAIPEAAILIVLALFTSAPLNPLFFLIIVSYLVIQLFYSLGLKNIAVLDILIIATGFIMRVYAGAFVIDAHLSVWFLLCVISVALFLASGKRRAELNAAGEGSLTRKSLGTYGRELLNSFVTMFGNASWMSWALYTFFESPKATLPFWLVLAELSKTTTVNKLLMLTIPITIFGIMRYESLIFEERAEAPEKLLLTDTALLITVGLWLGVVYWILYSGVSVSTTI